MKVVLVTGGRAYGDRAHIYDTLDEEQPDLVIHGGAKTVHRDSNGLMAGSRGADWFAGQWCDLHDVPQLKAPYKRDLGTRGGPIRNTWMIGVLLMFRQQGHEVKVVAFPGGAGTGDTVEKAICADILVTMMMEEVRHG